MKKILILILAMLSLFIAACGSDEGEASGSDESVNLRISTGLPDTHQWMLGYFNPMLEEIKEKSGEQLDYTLFTSGELVATREEQEALNSGTIDVAIPLHPIYDPERFPLAEVTMLPILTSNVEIATEAFNNLINSEEELTDGMNYREYVYEQHGLKVFPMVSTQPYVISTTNTEIKSAEDLAALKLRSGARVHDLFASNIGASPISLPFTDLYDGLSKGTLDGTLLAIPDWTSYGIEDLFSYTLEGINLGHYSALTAMTMEKWESLPETVQTAFNEASQNQLQSGIDNWLEVNEEVVKETEANGAQFVSIQELDQEIQDMFNDAIEKTWLQWIEDVEKQGQPAKDVAIMWRDLIIDAGGEVPAALMDIE
ncbi:TRAP transporter substrate-binding protein [Oceanobacillus damuensis]|uniref:TRAP transporter substrate-binding protein n=1 Tax=Oceanobacillus damuensis TaxID=937928 RepID=UPI0008316588|nr:TRAP transporter substrate-binding protein DctP [Oceanobacillus damuensis]